VSSRVEESTKESELYDFRYEVIDPASNTVLVSGLIDTMPDEDNENAPAVSLLLPRSRLSYRPFTKSGVLRGVEFFSLTLEAKSK
jgi:hypothetical protein